MKGERRRPAVIAALALALVAGLAGCASAPPAAPPGPALTGRIAVSVAAGADGAARSMSAAFDLRGDARDGWLSLSTPLGSRIAQAHWSPGDVVLDTPQGQRRYADIDDLSRDALGEALPLAALFDWLRGRPWPGAPSTAADGGFEQLGWTVDLAGLDAQRVTATRQAAPQVRVRALLDRP